MAQGIKPLGDHIRVEPVEENGVPDYRGKKRENQIPPGSPGEDLE